MRVAVMQPYLFPYIPYFQLIHAADRFVLLDTVQFIRGGWMRRNRIKLNGEAHLFSLPAQKNAPLDTSIANMPFAANAAEEAVRVTAMLRQAYRKARHWAQVETLVLPLLERVAPGAPFIDAAEDELVSLSRVMGIDTPFVRASSMAPRRSEAAQDYVIDLCEELGATEYINAPGGRELYDAEAFAARGMTLRFLDSEFGAYDQGGGEFTPGLSIIDALAHLPLDTLAQRLHRYRLAD